MYSVLSKMPCMQTKSVLDQIKEKAGPDHKEVMSRYPELSSIFQSVHPALPTRLHLLHAIP